MSSLNYVPFFGLHPGIPKNRTVSQTVLSIDLAPTFLDMTGADYSDKKTSLFDGISFLDAITTDGSLATATAAAKRESFLIEYTGEGGHRKIDKGMQQLFSSCIILIFFLHSAHPSLFAEIFARSRPDFFAIQSH